MLILGARVLVCGSMSSEEPVDHHAEGSPRQMTAALCLTAIGLETLVAHDELVAVVPVHSSPSRSVPLLLLLPLQPSEVGTDGSRSHIGSEAHAQGKGVALEVFGLPVDDLRDISEDLGVDGLRH